MLILTKFGWRKKCNYTFQFKFRAKAKLWRFFYFFFSSHSDIWPAHFISLLPQASKRILRNGKKGKSFFVIKMQKWSLRNKLQARHYLKDVLKSLFGFILEHKKHRYFCKAKQNILEFCFNFSLQFKILNSLKGISIFFWYSFLKLWRWTILLPEQIPYF